MKHQSYSRFYLLVIIVSYRIMYICINICIRWQQIFCNTSFIEDQGELSIFCNVSISSIDLIEVLLSAGKFNIYSSIVIFRVYYRRIE